MIEYQLEYSHNGGSSWTVLQAWAPDQSEPLDTTTLPDGTLLLRAKARDSVDRLESAGAPISVSVVNTVVRTTTLVASATTLKTSQRTLAASAVATATRQRTLAVTAQVTQPRVRTLTATGTTTLNYQRTLHPSVVAWAQGRRLTVTVGAALYVATLETAQFYRLTGVLTPAFSLVPSAAPDLALSASVATALRMRADIS